jgi:hypothetical protein
MFNTRNIYSFKLKALIEVESNSITGIISSICSTFVAEAIGVETVG